MSCEVMCYVLLCDVRTGLNIHCALLVLHVMSYQVKSCVVDSPSVSRRSSQSDFPPTTSVLSDVNRRLTPDVNQAVEDNRSLLLDPEVQYSAPFLCGCQSRV